MSVQCQELLFSSVVAAELAVAAAAAAVVAAAAAVPCASVFFPLQGENIFL